MMASMDPLPHAPLYLQLSAHYRQAIDSAVLAPGQRMPSVRALTRLHQVSLSTALQACHTLEDEGYLEARPRSGYFVLKPRRNGVLPLDEPVIPRKLDPAQYVGIHDQVSDYVAKCESYPLLTNMAAAYCQPEAYPAEALKNAAIRALRRQPEMLVSGVQAQGDPALRQVLARRALASGMSLSADEILVTNGCIEALNIALRAVAQPGDTIAVESPTYYGLLQILASLGMRALEIPTSPHTGISIPALELALRTHGGIKAVVVMPNLHNPLCSVMPDEAKAKLVALCEKEKVALIEDDTYGALVHGDTALKAAKAWDHSGNVIHCASLRKTMAPGLRLGWISGGRWQARIRMLKYAQSRSNEALAQLTMAEYMGSSAYDRHLIRLRRLLALQRDQFAEAIAAHFPAGTRFSLPSGSMLLWVELPAGTSAARLFDSAMQQGICVAPGNLFSNSTRFDHFLRLSYSAPFSRQIDQALRQLAGIVAAAGPGSDAPMASLAEPETVR
jgi:DNA-binding transcriptional MocR family regulator